MARARAGTFWKYIRGLAPPVVILALLVAGLGYALYSRVQAWEEADQYSLHEWVNESRPYRKTLPELTREYLQGVNELEDVRAQASAASGQQKADLDSRAVHRANALRLKRNEIEEHLTALGRPVKTYQGMLPLFPNIYRLELRFDGSGEELAPIAWDSRIPRPETLQPMNHSLLGEQDRRATLLITHQLHAYSRKQQVEADQRRLTMWLVGLAAGGAILGVAWVYLFLRRERLAAMRQMETLQQIDRAEKLLLEKEIHRQEAERKREEIERRLLEQRVATHEAEQHALELKSQLYASIGIMAGSYAHNIKNLLVRPNDLLRRCIESDGMSQEQEHMLQEVRGTLNTVTDRLQEILKTIRRDPTRSEFDRIDLNDLLRELHAGWQEMATQKWKLELRLELAPEPLWIDGDRSHLMQAIENLLFNARDATFEMRNLVRDEARDRATAVTAVPLSEEARRKALIQAAAWRGEVMLRGRVENGQAIIEVADNGAGMSEEVRRRCTETHFSTKRDNALHEGNSTGMGLGLSFVQTILDHHRAELEIASAPRTGATFRLRFNAGVAGGK